MEVHAKSFMEHGLLEICCPPKWGRAKGIDFELTHFGSAPTTRQGTSEKH